MTVTFTTQLLLATTLCMHYSTMVVTTTTNRREIEGMSVTGSSLYVQFAQRAELTKGRIQ
ncbi:hypothetical protein LAYK3_13830 [Lactobacillus amylovorus subsp. amylovorus]|nr:hypothetical protein LAYK3_13830 [Lactobacillus amylovorus]GMM19035.1 hypothetical protein LAYK6_02470 [Lactobacillus amylovorus]GMM21324.1 hypothetical protein LAYK10_06260 [Lactobacillus amylovorus]